MYLYGQKDFLHEYISLNIPSASLSVVTSGRGAIICEIYAFSQGDLPDFVQIWDEPYVDADMLLLSTHADDEHLFFGGTMPYYAGELKYKVQVAYLTHHWAEPYRPHELLNGLWTVGITAYPVIGEFPDYYSDSLDHAKSLYDIEEVFAYEVGLLRRFKPEVVIGHDVNGEYGHGVHMLNTWVLQQAIHLAADEAYLPRQVAQYGAFQTSKVYLHLYPENSVVMDWNIPLDHFGGKTALEMAELGFAEHISQQKWFSVRTTGVHDCRAFGLYYTGVGKDSGEGTPDFFEHVEVFSDDPVPLPPAASEPEDIGESDGKISFKMFADFQMKWELSISVAMAVLFLLLIKRGRKGNRG
jgi:LmbE family N-acetylglucosaminyl deacetylase